MRNRHVYTMGCGRRPIRREGRRSLRITGASASPVLLALAALAMSGCGWNGGAAIPPMAAKVQPSGDHYQAARVALAKGDTAKAALEVKLALQDNPLDARAHFLFACLLEMKGEHDQAVVGFQRALATDSSNPEVFYNLGTLLLRRGEAVPAGRLLENAVSLRPSHVPSWINLAKAYYLADLPELTVAAYEEVLRQDPTNAVALRNLIILAEGSGLWEPAAIYRRRLGAAQLGRAANPAASAGNRAGRLPTWPTAAVQVAPSAETRGEVLPPPRQEAIADVEAANLRDLVRDLPNVTVERRGDRLTLTGWTSGVKERSTLDRILGKGPGAPDRKGNGDAGRTSDVLDLTNDDTGDPQRMIEVDAVIFITTGLDSQSEGFNFLQKVNLNFNYFAADHKRDGTGYSAPPAVIGNVLGLSQQGWIFGASVNYVVEIANASDQRVAVLARPHLTTLSGTPAKFLAGGELVFKVSGINSGDIKLYPFGTSLVVTPTLLRTQGQDGTPRVRMVVEAGRTSVLSILDTNPDQPTAFQKVNVTSEAVVGLGQTLILSGLSQRESHSGLDGVPGLMDVPVLKYLTSTKTSLKADTAVIILLTPRDPAFQDEANRKAIARFVEMRRAFLRARQGGPGEMQRFRDRYPDWREMAANRFASHLFLLETSELYRAVSAQDLTGQDVDLELLGPRQKPK